MNGCALFLALGIGAVSTPSVDLAGDNPIAILRAGAECVDYAGDGLVLEYEHQSSIPDGPPINDHRDQRWQERAVIYYKWTWR